MEIVHFAAHEESITWINQFKTKLEDEHRKGIIIIFWDNYHESLNNTCIHSFILA